MNIRSVSKYPLLIGVVSMGIIMPHAVTAEEKPTLEEVVVTAQKREENLQDVPIAISALSSSDMEALRITDTNSIAAQVPNLHIKQGVGADMSYAIRGLSNNHNANIGYEGTVGWYMDGVYFGKGMATLFDLGDVERIEVLRGPQGTLYGRNTIGGAINLVSARPSGEFGGKVKIGVGDENLVETAISLDLPSIGTEDEGLGTLAARVSYSSRERDGFTKNVPSLSLSPADAPAGTFSRFGDMDREALHVALDWNISSAFSVSYDYISSSVDDTPRLFQLIDTTPGVREPGFEDYAVTGFPSKGVNNGNVYFNAEIDSHSVIAT